MSCLRPDATSPAAAGPPAAGSPADGHAAGPSAEVPPADPAGTPYDPLRLCIFATIAGIGWLLGPIALTLFAALGFVGYAKARRAGLTRSKCFLRDTRLVLGYLGLLVVAGLAGIWLMLL